MAQRILAVSIQAELDVVAARQRARQIAGLCGFAPQEQTKIATAVSELARNIHNYAGKGRVEFSMEGDTPPQVLLIRVEDEGPGIAELDLILSGRYKSTTGMGLGILGAKRLMDQFDVASRPEGGTCITLKKLLPAGAPLFDKVQLGELAARLMTLPGDSALAELQQQNQELMNTLSELKARQDELLQLTRELEDTNRGVVALYAELDEKAGHLRRADEMKSRFLSNMSHEFRTPLSSIRALSKLLLDHVDGPLTIEQEKQVRFIQKGAESLTELVDDLLDLAKIEAGKIEVRAAHFKIADLFSALRGMLRPLLVSERVRLVFDEAADLPPMYTDEAKLSQILRNFISNALKFTEEGEVAVTAQVLPKGMMRVSVRDTGLGIAPEHLEIIFEEFSQVENRLQGKVKGTGLGLPLCRKLAEVLGGRVEVESTPGLGSTFSVLIPTVLDATGAADAAAVLTPPCGIPLLVVEDSAQMRLIYEKMLEGSEFSLLPARSVWEAERLWAMHPPAAVLLDIHLQNEDTWRWLSELKADAQRKTTPVIVVSDIDDKRKGLALGADAYFLKPVLGEQLLDALRRLIVTTDEGRDDGAHENADNSGPAGATQAKVQPS